MTSRITELRLATIVALGLALLFAGFPEIDRQLAGFFARDDWHWLFARNSLLVDLPYLLTPWLGRGLILGLFAAWAASFFTRFGGLRRHRLLSGFLLLAALIGPVLIVDAGLKQNVGRARPAQIADFGGERQFTPAFVVSDQCRGNCSFVSGHVATTAFIMAFGWLGQARTRHRWLQLSLAASAYMALIRMATGGHFLSDCVFAWFAVYFGLWLTQALYARLSWVGDARGSFRRNATRLRGQFAGFASGLSFMPR